MAEKGSTPNRILTAVVFILMEAAAIGMLSQSGEKQGLWLAEVSGGFKAFFWGWSEKIHDYFNLSSRNQTLAAENTELLDRLHKYEQALMSHQIDSLAAMQRKNRSFQFIAADIVKMSTNRELNYIILDKGSSDGVMADDGIITASGVVGVIDAVSENYSYGRTFLNRDINVSARLGRDGVVGRLAWNGRSSNAALLQEVPLHTQYAPGDTVYTSGQSMLYPGNIPIGIAGKVNRTDGVSNEVDVTLMMDFSTLKHVTIAHHVGREEIRALEARGGTR